MSDFDKLREIITTKKDSENLNKENDNFNTGITDNVSGGELKEFSRCKVQPSTTITAFIIVILAIVYFLLY